MRLAAVCALLFLACAAPAHAQTDPTGYFNERPFHVILRGRVSSLGSTPNYQDPNTGETMWPDGDPYGSIQIGARVTGHLYFITHPNSFSPFTAFMTMDVDGGKSTWYQPGFADGSFGSGSFTARGIHSIGDATVPNAALRDAGQLLELNGNTGHWFGDALASQYGADGSILLGADITSATLAPEPSAVLLILPGLAPVGLLLRRRRHRGMPGETNTDPGCAV